MQILTLSDHAADQARKAGEQREANFRQACSHYNALMEERAQGSARLAARRRQDWDRGRYFSWLLQWFPCLMHACSARPLHPRPQEATRDEIVWSKGSEGEQKVVVHLSRLLDDRWILIGGFRNAKGELDQLLVGPGGLIAIEVKFVNGRVSCDGDRWWRDKYDRYGNLVERALPITDKRGRGPSEQVNAVADLLERQIGKRVQLPRIVRAVILSHDNSERGDIRSAKVDLVTTLSSLTAGSFPHATILAPHQIQVVVDSIRREHESFKAPSLRKRMPSASPYV
jgi:hypothetical protein